MKLNIFINSQELLWFFTGDECVLPNDLRKLILLFSGHMFVGDKSISWIVYF